MARISRSSSTYLSWFRLQAISWEHSIATPDPRACSRGAHGVHDEHANLPLAIKGTAFVADLFAAHDTEAIAGAQSGILSGIEQDLAVEDLRDFYGGAAWACRPGRGRRLGCRFRRSGYRGGLDRRDGRRRRGVRRAVESNGVGGVHLHPNAVAIRYETRHLTVGDRDQLFHYCIALGIEGDQGDSLFADGDVDPLANDVESLGWRRQREREGLSVPREEELTVVNLEQRGRGLRVSFGGCGLCRRSRLRGCAR